MLRIKLVKSLIGNTKRNRSIVAALGLKKMHHQVDHRDTPQIRGMVHRVKHLLEVTEIKESEAVARTTGTPQRARTVPPGSVPKAPRKVAKKRPAPVGKAPRAKAAKAPKAFGEDAKPKGKSKAATKVAAIKAAAVKPAPSKPEPKAKAEAAPKAEKPKAEKKAATPKPEKPKAAAKKAPTEGKKKK